MDDIFALDGSKYTHSLKNAPFLGFVDIHRI